MSVNTGGGPYIGGNVNVQGDFIGRDKNIICIENKYYLAGITDQHTPIPLSSVLDPAALDLPPLSTGRAEELALLTAWYDAVLADRRGKQSRLVIITGAAGIGKRTLLRQWRADLLARPSAPTVAVTSYLPRYISQAEQESYYSDHPGWRDAWALHATALRSRYRHTETLGGLAWVALAAQLVQQSATALATLTRSEPLVGDADLPTIRRRMSDLVRVAVDDGPLVLILEGVDHAQFTVLEPLLHQWRTVLHDLPFLLVLVVDTPYALHGQRVQQQSNDWLTWLRDQTAPPPPKARALHVGPLRVDGVAALLTDDSQEYAPALHYATHGAPALLQELLRHAQQQGQAMRAADGRWRLYPGAFTLSAGALFQQFIVEPLHACAARAQDLGFAVAWETLLEWLHHAAWEGEIFTDEALAHAVGMHGDALEDFQVLLDEALVRREDEPDAPGLLMELEETVVLPTGDLGHPEHHMALYRFEPPLLAGLLYNRQHGEERLARGSRYVQGLVNAYQPFVEQVAPTLVQICRTLGRVEDADRFRRLIAPPAELAQAETTLAAMRTFAQTEPSGQHQLVHYVLDFVNHAHRRRHPRPLLPLLAEALAYARQLGQPGNEAGLLHHMGWCYHDLGEMQQALEYYNLALPLHRQVDNKAGEASTLTNLGIVYADLDEKQQALKYYQQALPLHRQVGDKAGEAITLTGIGTVYAALGKKQQALEYYEQALLLQRQVGDKTGEAVTLTNLGAVYAALGDKTQALGYYKQALPLHRQVGNKDGEARTLTGIGHVYYDLGDKQQALEYYEQALPLHRQVGNKEGEATTLTSIGIVYSALGEKQQALEYYEQALPLRRQVGDKAGEATTLTSIGIVYADLGDKTQALAYCEQALPLFRQVGDRWHESMVRYSMAMVYKALGELAAAEAQLIQAVALDELLGHPNLKRDRQALAEIQALRRQGAGNEG